MSFFSRLNLQPVFNVQPSHTTMVDGFPSQQENHLSINTKIEVDTTSTSPKTAKLLLRYGTNSFQRTGVIIGKGFYAKINKNQSDVIDLYMTMIKGNDLRVAQIMADVEMDFIKSKIIRDVKGFLVLTPGIHSLTDDISNLEIEFYFLSQHVF